MDSDAPTSLWKKRRAPTGGVSPSAYPPPRDQERGMDLNELRHRTLLDPNIPQGLRRALEAGASLESIHLDARGRWWHQGEPFINQRLIDLFHRSLHQTQAGTWLLTIPPFSYPVTVEHTGRFVHRVERRGEDYFLLTRDGREVSLDPARLSTDGVDGLFTDIDGQTARLVDDAWKALSPLVDQIDGGWVLNWLGQRYTLCTYKPANVQGAK